MSKLLKLLLSSALPMYVGEEGGGKADDHDLDDDLDDEGSEGSDEGGEKSDEKKENEVVLEGEDETVTIEEDTGESAEDREKIRESRRKERQERKERAKEREASTKRELAAERAARKELEDRLARIEGKDKSRELAAIDENIKRVANAYSFQKDRLQQAHEQHDGAAAADATEKMLAARDNFNQLKSVKDGFERSLKAPAALDERLVSNAQAFMSDHKWYKPGSNDQDTKITQVIDNALADEGWDPKTPEYWQELRARIKNVLPHRVAGGKVATVDVQSSPQRKSVVAGGEGSQATASKGTFVLSKDRVSALKEAGMWNDPAARADAIKRFREYDKQNKG